MMKKTISFLLVLMLVCCLFACQKEGPEDLPDAPGGEEQPVEIPPEEEPPVAGGWTVAEEELTDETAGYFRAATDGLAGVAYTPLKVIGKQVVAGINYRYLCDATGVFPGAVTVKKVVTVFVDLDGNAAIIEITDYEEAD